MNFIELSVIYLGQWSHTEILNSYIPGYVDSIAPEYLINQSEIIYESHVRVLNIMFVALVIDASMYRQ